MRPSSPTPQGLQPERHPSKFPPRTMLYPRNNPGKTFCLNWWIDWSVEEKGWCSTSEPNGMNGPLNGSPKCLSHGVFPSDKRSWMFRREAYHSIESAHQFSSRPSCNNTAEVPSFCALLSQQFHLFLICVVSTYNDSRRNLHRLCRIPRNCQRKTTLGFDSKKFCKLLCVSCEVFVLHGYDWFHWVAKSCTTTAYRWLFRDSQLSLRTLWSAVIKSPKFSCTRYGSAIASSARGPCNFWSSGRSRNFSVFREMSANTVLTQIRTSRRRRL